MISEEKIIKIFEKDFPPDENVIVGIGDDAAVIKVKEKMIITTDSLVEGVHFKRNFLSPEDIGWKLLIVNISDISAMGGIPKYFLLSLSLPPDIDLKFIKRFSRGIKECATLFNVKLIGGNLTFCKGGLNFSLTLIAEPLNSVFAKRHGAEAENDIYVSQPLGGSSLGLKILREKPQLKKRFPDLIKVFKRPIPNLKLSEILIKNNLVTSMIDISDGFLIDLNRILKVSSLGAEIMIENIPVMEEVLSLCEILKISYLPYVLTGGEDYALLWTSKSKDRDKVKNLLNNEGMKVYCIGKIKKKPKKIKLTHYGKEIPLPEKLGFDHFSRMQLKLHGA